MCNFLGGAYRFGISCHVLWSLDHYSAERSRSDVERRCCSIGGLSWLTEGLPSEIHGIEPWPCDSGLHCPLSIFVVYFGTPTATSIGLVAFRKQPKCVSRSGYVPISCCQCTAGVHSSLHNRLPMTIQPIARGVGDWTQSAERKRRRSVQTLFVKLSSTAMMMVFQASHDLVIR